VLVLVFVIGMFGMQLVGARHLHETGDGARLAEQVLRVSNGLERRVIDLEAVPDGQTASSGIAEWDGKETGEALTARADAALRGQARRPRPRDPRLAGAPSPGVRAFAGVGPPSRPPGAARASLRSRAPGGHAAARPPGPRAAARRTPPPCAAPAGAAAGDRPGHLLRGRSRSSPFGSRGSRSICRRRVRPARLNDRCSRAQDRPLVVRPAPAPPAALTRRALSRASRRGTGNPR
jgi:hypothetical protein